MFANKINDPELLRGISYNALTNEVTGKSNNITLFVSSWMAT